ncbi:hypothetical protein FRC11_015032 [Ceratobasidium sp. 423]|nr:hypothetical protein FRC11_015032 [Ceratobasidium sp. 423]
MSSRTEPLLEDCQLGASSVPSLSDKATSIAVASTAIGIILTELVRIVKEFKCPTELDFSNVDSALVLSDAEKNKAFSSQLCKLNALLIRLDRIQTHGYAPLMNKHKATGAAIRKALERMEEQKLKLYEKATDAALSDISIVLNDCLGNFEYPSELDFPTNTDNKLVLLNTEKNKPFLNQLRKLDGLRTKWAEIPTHGNEKLEKQRRAIGVRIGGALQKMKEHQLKLQEKHETASQPPKCQGHWFSWFSGIQSLCPPLLLVPS